MNKSESLVFSNAQMERDKANKERKDQANKEISYYRGEHKKLVKDYISTKFHSPDDLRISYSFTNITKSIVDGESYLYREEPKRELRKLNGKLDKKNTQKLNMIYDRAKADLFLEENEKYNNLLWTTVPRVGWDEDNKCIDFSLLHPGNLDVLTEDGYPNRPTVYEFPIYNPDDSIIKKDPVMYEHWDIENAYLVDSEGEIHYWETNPDGVNPYGVLPFVPFWKFYPHDRFFIKEGEDELINAQENNNIHLSLLNRSFKYGITKVLVLYNTKQKAVVWDPSVPLALEGNMAKEDDPKVEFVGPGMEECQKAWDIIYKEIRHICVMRNVSPSRFEFNADPSSGIALRIKNIPSERLIKERKKYYRLYERDLARVIIKVWNYHNENDQIPEDLELSVDFSDVEYPEDPEKIQRVDEWELNYGFTNVAQIAMRKNPDLTNEKQALEWIQQNLKINEAFSKGSGLGSIVKEGQQDEILNPNKDKK